MGPDYQILIIEPLFEEANRTRRMIATMIRLLTARYLSATIAELPGTGESLIDIADVRLPDWQAGVAAAIAATGATVIASFRGGALLDGGSLPVWRFAPEAGARIVRDLRRVKASGSSDTYAGHALNDAFLDELEAAQTPSPARLRTVRLATDSGVADVKVEGSPLWRRAEPGEDQALSEALAADLGRWIEQCAAS